MSHYNIGWVGLGKMGVPMVKRLINAGHRVIVYNRTIERAKELEASGATVASSPAELYSSNDFIFLMVSDDNATKDVIAGPNGLLAGRGSDKIIVNMSTVSPTISKEMQQLCKEKGSYYLDAPVSGSVKQATNGELVIMVGGDEQHFKKVELVFRILGKLCMRVGDTGAGNVAKLAINTLLALHAQGLAETIQLAKANGIDASTLMTLINNSAIGNAFMGIKGDAIANDNYTAAFALKHIAKDLRLAKDIGLNSPLANTAFDSFTKAEKEYGDEDIIAIHKYMQEKS